MRYFFAAVDATPKAVARTLLVLAVSGAVMWILLSHTAHAAGPGRIGKAIIRHGVKSQHMRHFATHNWGPTKHGLFPRRGTIGPPMSPERYLWEIIKNIGKHRLSGAWPFVPPGVPGVGSGSGIPI